MKNFWHWLRGILSVIGGIWVICIIAGFFGSIMMNCGRVVYVPVPATEQSAGRGARSGPPVVFDNDRQGAGSIGIPMLQPVRVVPYDVIERNEYGIRRRGILPPVCVPQQYPRQYRLQ